MECGSVPSCMVRQSSVLVIEDDPSIRESLTKVLVGEGFQVFGAASLEEALFRCRESEIDSVLLDLNLGYKDGWDTFHALTELDPDLTIIITSAQWARFADSSVPRASA